MSALTAMEDCVRGVARRLPLRTPSQLRQLQFHCGNPPPAAAPNYPDSHFKSIAETPRKKDKSPVMGPLSKPNA